MTVPAPTMTPKHMAQQAAWDGDLGTLQKLCESQDSLLQEIGATGATLLHDAATNGHCDVLEWLIDKGMDVNAVDEFGGSVLFEAIYHDHPEAADLLKMKGARLRVPRHIKIVALSQFAMGVAALVPLALIALLWGFRGWRMILLFFLPLVFLSTVLQGTLGLMGRQTFANSP